MIEVKMLEGIPEDSIYILPQCFHCPFCGIGIGSPHYVILWKITKCPKGCEFTVNNLANQIGVIKGVKA